MIPSLHPPARTLNCRGRLVSLERPLVMGILNLTPDSFSDGGRFNDRDRAMAHVDQMVGEGADIIDVGGYSSRPGAAEVPPQEELDRIQAITSEILREFPDLLVSVDTFRSTVAKAMLDAGTHIINDISAGELDPDMMATVAAYDAPYIMMHMQGTPATMQQRPQYEDVSEDILQYLVERIRLARAAGITDLILDPGFGFGKSLAHNYELFQNLDKFSQLGLPVLVGISRKSMLYKAFDTTPDDVQDLSAALHLQALKAGARILRVHDVKAARRIVHLHEMLIHGAV